METVPPENGPLARENEDLLRKRIRHATKLAFPREWLERNKGRAFSFSRAKHSKAGGLKIQWSD